MDTDDMTLEQDTHSKSNLIEFQHVGVTAKIQSPLKRVLPECSSAETDMANELFHRNTSTTKYNKLQATTGNDSESTTTATTPSLMTTTTSTTETSKLLYEMHAEHSRIFRSAHGGGDDGGGGKALRGANTISRIEFQLYNKPLKKRHKEKRSHSHQHHHYYLQQQKRQRRRQQQQQQQLHHHQQQSKKKHVSIGKKQIVANKTPSIFQRLGMSLRKMCSSKAPILSMDFVEANKHATSKTTSGLAAAANAAQHQQQQAPQNDLLTKSPRGQDTNIGIYPFEHGCAEYLRATDCPPQILSNVLAERATYYATRFWAEFFGSLHIGVSFVVTFILQSYRFLLYSLVNTLLVGLLQMTSDYFLKPLLTVIFNGFVQPPLIFLYNILTSLRDLLEPIADALNNFMKPVATVGRSLRLIHATYNKKKFVKDV